MMCSIFVCLPLWNLLGRVIIIFFKRLNLSIFEIMVNITELGIQVKI